MNTIRYTVAAASTALGMVFGHPPVAHADQWNYVTALDDNGVAYSDVVGVIELGKQVCHHLRGGRDFRDAMDVITGPLSYSVPEGAVIIAAAVAFMCPDADPILQQQLGNRTPGSTTDQVA